MNRSLTGLSTQVCHLQFFQSRSTFLTGRRSDACPFVALHLFLCRTTFFLCPVASPLFPCAVKRPVTSPCGARRAPFCMQRPLPRPVSSPTQCFVFFLLPLCRQQRLSAPLSGHFTRAQKYFFWAVLAEAFSLFLCLVLHASGESFSGCACRIVFWVCMQSQVVSCLRA